MVRVIENAGVAVRVEVGVNVGLPFGVFVNEETGVKVGLAVFVLV